MRTIELEKELVDVYDYKDFPYYSITNCSTVKQKRKKEYVNLICTFDIETTTVLEKERFDDYEIRGDLAFMYVWQFCVNGIICMGRTWKEYISFITKLSLCLELEERNRYLVIYVHNLSFEFQFLRNYITVNKVFATEKRNVLFFTHDNFEYRCSYRLSNMSLENFLKKTKNVIHYKKSGDDFDYDIKRYPDTELTNEEYGYCICDVLGLYEAIKSMLESNDDTLATIPYTSTGYVRRDYRSVCCSSRKHMELFHKKVLSPITYTLCKEASRGAISGSNHIYTDETLECIDSEDIKSSYPFQMATKYFPVTRFLQYDVKVSNDKLKKLIDTRCCIIVWSCENFKLKRWCAIPYVSKAKCRAIDDARCGNGKVYYAKRIGMCCTEIDFNIIIQDYHCENIKIHEIWCAERGQLSKPFRKHLLEMFQLKTDLEDGDKFLYNKYKNKINASFGMMLTDILNPEITFENDSLEAWNEIEVQDIRKALYEYYNNAKNFLSYQDGIWVLAHGRADLHRGMEIVGNDIVQVDTDSVKHFNNYSKEFDSLNKTIIEKAEDYDIKPYSVYKDGRKAYLGVWEHEGKKGEFTYDKFRTLGAKKYCCEQNGVLQITVAGLNKNAWRYLESHGRGIESFSNGTLFPYETETGEKVSGRSSLLYYDSDRIWNVCIDGHDVSFGSYVAFRKANYTLGLADEWYDMVANKDLGESFPIDDGMFKGW